MSSRKRTRSRNGSLPLLARALESIANSIFITDAEGHIVWANAAFSRLSGYPVREVMGRTPSFLKSGQQDRAFYAALWQTVRAGRVWQAEVVERHRDGSLYAVDEIITPLVDAHGRVSHFIAIQHDITQRRLQAQQDHHLANHDVLTGLPNRLCFEGALRQALAGARREQRTLSLLYIDLDHFKPINDSLGHLAGDLLLVMVAARMRSMIRGSDMVARLGGDEFGVLLHDQGDATLAATLAAKLIAAISQPYALQDRDVVIGASVGVARFPLHGDSPGMLLERADAAMYRAKAAGGNACRSASPEAEHTMPRPPAPAAD
jgi:diguanylate cyclase (GGDEF)-like protein/PAS domain S-box-containing protein